MAASAPKTLGKAKSSIVNRHLVRDLDFTNIAQKVIDLMSKLCSFEKLVFSTIEEYVGFHRYLPKDLTTQLKVMTDSERQEFDQEVAISIAIFVSEINAVSDALQGEHGQTVQHYNEICRYLLQRAGELTKVAQNMRKERMRYDFKPLRLGAYTAQQRVRHGDQKLPASLAIPAKIPQQQKHQPHDSLLSPALVAAKQAADIADRYDGEIASISRMKQYKQVGESYKALLTKEAKDLSTQFSEELKIVRSVEGNVEQISSLLGEFLQIVQSQSHKVESIYDTGLSTTDLVKQADREMQKTIDNSRSYQWNMVVLSVFLAALLLVLDWITP